MYLSTKIIAISDGCSSAAFIPAQLRIPVVKPEHFGGAGKGHYHIITE